MKKKGNFRKVVSGLLAGCGSSSDGKKSADKEKFIVGFDAAFPPY